MEDHEGQYREIFEKSPIGILFYDKEGQLVDANQSALKIARISQFKDVKGTNLFDNPYIESHKEELLKNGFIRFQSPLDLDIIKEQGFYTPTSLGTIYIDYTISITDFGYLVQMQDITKQETAEGNQKKSEIAFKNFFSRILDYAYIVSPEGKIIDVNDAAIRALGYEREELIDKPLSMIYSPESLQKMIQLFAKWKETGELKNEEMIIVTKTGEKLTVLLNVGAVRDKNGTILYSTSLQTDITERKKAEEVLQITLQRFYTILSNMRASVLLVTEENRIEFANQAFCDYFDIAESPADLVGLKVSEMIKKIKNAYQHPDEAVSRIREIVSRWQPVIGEEVSMRDGRTCLRDFVPIFVGEKPYGRLWLHFDITKHKKAEEELRKAHDNLEEQVEERTMELEEAYESLKGSEEKFRLIFNEAEDSIVLNEITENGLPGKIIEANEATSKRLGYTKEELLNMTPKEVVAPESRAEMPKNAEKLRREGHAIFEILHMAKDGRRIPVEVDNHLIEFKGKKTSLTVVRDITGRKRAEEEIKRKNKVLDGINSIFRATITNIDEEEFGKTCLAVCEEITGSEFSFIGEINEMGRFDSIAVSERGWQACEMVKEQGAESVDDNVIRGIRSRAIKEKKILIFNDPTDSPYWSGLPDGHYPIISFLGAPLIYRDKIIGLIALANKKSGYSKEDIEVMEVITIAITESLMHYRALKQLEENQNELKETIGELERSNKELQSFAYITSHDLQEPLRTMGNYAGLLKRRYEGQLDSDADDFLNFMESGAARMQDMITGLLDYSRVGTKGEEFKEFNASDALNTALVNLQSSLEECNAEVTRDPLPVIYADKAQISRIFQNLIGNALKFRREGIQPKIHISARKEEKEYVFSVADNGIGIEEQYTGRIFEVFKRLHAIGEYQGTGIGLAIVKRIIDRHGGHIWVESKYGKGSVFYFTIPIKQ